MFIENKVYYLLKYLFKNIYKFSINFSCSIIKSKKIYTWIKNIINYIFFKINEFIVTLFFIFQNIIHIR